jgi:hypothetical protein
MFASIKDTALPTGSGIFPDGAVKPFLSRADEQKLQANVHFTLNSETQSPLDPQKPSINRQS